MSKIIAENLKGQKYLVTVLTNKTSFYRVVKLAVYAPWMYKHLNEQIIAVPHNCLQIMFKHAQKSHSHFSGC